MNEVSDYIGQKGNEIANSPLIKEAFKIFFKVGDLSSKTLAVAMKKALQATKGFTDMGVEAYNLVNENKKGKSDKHTHKPGLSTSFSSINKRGENNNQTLESVSVSDKKMMGFETVARQYGIKYGIKKVVGSKPPEWEVYFQAKDKNKMANAFKDFTNRQLKNYKEKPTEKIARMMSRMTEHVKTEKSHRRGGHEL